MIRPLSAILRPYKLIFLWIPILLVASIFSLIWRADERGNWDTKTTFASNHHLAVIIPFRNTFDELQQFVPYMSRFLNNQTVPHQFFVINQVDDNRFNRASLINIGYLYAKKDARFDYLVMHDVDLLPLNPQLRYEYPGDGVALHIASPKLHPTYHYPNFVGGILILTMNDFKRLNGLSNKYWGWGREDDDFFWRMKSGRVSVIRTVNVTTGTKDSFKHLHTKRVRDKVRCLNQQKAIRKVESATGIKDVDYKIESVNTLSINGSSLVTIVNVELGCNKKVTPWCRCGK